MRVHDVDTCKEDVMNAFFTRQYVELIRWRQLRMSGWIERQYNANKWNKTARRIFSLKYLLFSGRKYIVRKVKFSLLISLIFMNYTHLVCKVLNKNIEKIDLNIDNPNLNLISKYWDY